MSLHKQAVTEIWKPVLIGALVGYVSGKLLNPLKDEVVPIAGCLYYAGLSGASWYTVLSELGDYSLASVTNGEKLKRCFWILYGMLTSLLFLCSIIGKVGGGTVQAFVLLTMITGVPAGLLKGIHWSILRILVKEELGRSNFRDVSKANPNEKSDELDTVGEKDSKLTCLNIESELALNERKQREIVE